MVTVQLVELESYTEDVFHPILKPREQVQRIRQVIDNEVNKALEHANQPFHQAHFRADEPLELGHTIHVSILGQHVQDNQSQASNKSHLGCPSKFLHFEYLLMMSRVLLSFETPSNCIEFLKELVYINYNIFFRKNQKRPGPNWHQ